MSSTRTPVTGTGPGAHPPARVVRARTAVAIVFGLNGLAMAAWFARVPAVRAALDLTPGELGLLLLALSAGSLLALPTAGPLTHRFGTARTAAAAALGVSTGLLVLGIAIGLYPSVAGSALGLFILGYGSGTCDVSMNVEAALVERRLARTIMPRFHAAWSLGTVTGAALGAGAARIALPVLVHLAAVALVAAIGTLVAVRFFLPAALHRAPGRPADDQTHAAAGSQAEAHPATEAAPAGAVGAARRRGSGALAAWREPRTLLIGLLVMVMAFVEGSANDWLAVAFVDGYGVSEATAAAVFGIFVAAMTVGRVVGTTALDRWGRTPVLFATIALAAAGAVLAVLAGSGPVAMVGVALWGLGASLGFPVGMSAAADDEERAAARVSVVAAIGYTAFLGGPPLIGLLADRVGTLDALLVIPALMIPALFLVPAARQPAASRPAPAPKTTGRSR